MADEHLERVKRLLLSLPAEDQQEIRDFLRRRVGLLPRASAHVGSVRTRGGQGAVTYREELVRCGKAGCRCEAAPCHGPYTYRYWREDGKLKKRYVGKRGAADAQAP